MVSWWPGFDSPKNLIQGACLLSGKGAKKLNMVVMINWLDLAFPACRYSNTNHSHEVLRCERREVNQRHLLEENGQWLENVDRTHLFLASGKPVLQKKKLNTRLEFIEDRRNTKEAEIYFSVKVLSHLHFFPSGTMKK